MFSNVFDKSKSAKNKIERGLDFIEARWIWQDPSLRTVEAKMVDGETRYASIGYIGDKLWVAIWVNVTETLSETDPAQEPLIRIISVHRAEKTRFERIYNGKED